MVVHLMLWSLGDSLTSVGELRRALGEDGARAPGLVFSGRVSDESTERFGTIDIWESRDAARHDVHGGVRELIGKDPEISELFDLEATSSIAPELAQLGLAFE